MQALTQEVLQQAMAQAAEWKAAGLRLSVAVNVSASTLLDAGLPERIEHVLAACGLDPSALQVEITEEFLMADRDRARAVLTRLRDRGVEVAVDDFGTGYSSLAYLRDLPIDELKLDRSFVLPMGGEPRAAALVASTIGLAHSLGLRMVAEGVEDEVAYARLTRDGCDQAQGYFICRPLPAAGLETWLDAPERRAWARPARRSPIAAPSAASQTGNAEASTPFARAAGRTTERARSGSERRSGQDSGLLGLELLVGDHTAAVEIGQLGQFVGRGRTGAAGHRPDVVLLRLLQGGRRRSGPLLHLAAVNDQVDQDTEERQNDDEERPERLAPAGHAAAEDVTEHRDQQPDPCEEQEEPEHGPEEIEERHGGFSLVGVGRWVVRRRLGSWCGGGCAPVSGRRRCVSALRPALRSPSRPTPHSRLRRHMIKDFCAPAPHLPGATWPWCGSPAFTRPG
jgi:EAL domain-containing protein (putative c-di-GMP-specific phosphodiesterase class I)